MFLTAFLLCAAAFLPFIIIGGGRFIFYGDYDAQQIPFYYHVHSALRQGSFGWDFTTDLGTDLFGSYTFYLLGSPFFWLTLPFPDAAVPYLMPWLICLKTAVAALTAYGLLREFTPNRNACFLGALLYAFSGFQLYNLMFNHFHDPTAFFPLLLLCSDKFMRQNKRGIFALIVALCAVTNYFFFAGMAVFTVIWFSVNIFAGRYKFSVKRFLPYAFEAVLGVLAAAVILLPSAAALTGNSRAGNLISPGNALIYRDKFTYIYILKSFFTFPDLPLESMFNVSEDLDCASAACFLPFVSASGVIAYIIGKRGGNASRKNAPPKNALPKNALPKNALPENVLHENALHENALHENALHENALHENALHENALHENASRKNVLHDNALHENAPHEKAPRKKTPCKDVLVITLALSVIFMFIPCLNAAFTLFNAQYYARWFFAPVLIMCIMTAVAAGEDIALFKKASLPCMAFAGAFTIGAALYIRLTGNGDPTAALVSGIIPPGCLGLLWSCLSDKAMENNSARLIGVTKRTALCCTLFTALVIAQGKMTVDRMTQRDYVNTALASRPEIEALKAETEGFFRVDMCENYVNRNLMWGIGSCSSFISTVNGSIADVQEAMGFPRLVNSQIPYDYAAYRSLTSVKYYFDSPMYDEEGKREPFAILGNNVEAFGFSRELAHMNLYENNCFIPMGFTYDHYISLDELLDANARIYRCNALLEAVALTNEQQEKFSDILTHYDMSACEYGYERLSEIAAAKREEACRDFYTDQRGFGAVFENRGDRDRLVFFSVPYDEGWSARINGEPVQIEKVSYGFMALRCKPGVSEIRFDYTSKPLAVGAAVSLCSLVVLAVYMLICGKQKSAKGD